MITILVVEDFNQQHYYGKIQVLPHDYALDF